MIQPVAENALLVTLADRIEPHLPHQLRTLCQRIEAQNWPWLEDLVPSYTTLLILYDPNQVDFRQTIQAVRPLLNLQAPTAPDDLGDARVIELPVYYSAESGPDLDALATDCGLSTDDVIKRHTSQTYQVYAMGFAPGFAFMGEVDGTIAHPRKDTPRQSVPAGSVGIANHQTAVYPVSSPGGWQLIGRCPTRLFDPDSLALLNTGDSVRFYSIGREEYLDLGGEL